MKKNLIFVALSVVMMFAASCQKTAVNDFKGEGFLSFGDLSLEIDEDVVTKGQPADEGYTLFIYKRVNDELGELVKTLKYSEVIANDDKISLTEGSYTLVARSKATEVPVAAWEDPYYGTSHDFTIVAGETTTVTEALVCRLLQCKVTVEYSDEFLAKVTGEDGVVGTTSVELIAGQPLQYNITKSGDAVAFDRNAGYFAVNGNTMTVTFKGSIEGKTQKMTKTFDNIAPRQWRLIKFIPKRNEEGTATFDIVIESLLDDKELNEDLTVKEEISGEDPEAPKGDGDIAMTFDYEGGCDTQLTDLENLLIVPSSSRAMNIKFNLSVPNGLRSLYVDIESDSTPFSNALTVVDAQDGIDLLYPTEKEMGIFEIVPFPYGETLKDDVLIPIDISDAQSAIEGFQGRHTFHMNVLDNTGCRKTIKLVMVVE